MVRRIYDMEPYRRKIMEASLEWMPQHSSLSKRLNQHSSLSKRLNQHSSLSKRLNYLGFKSCRYTNDYWEIDEVEFTWFVLRFS